jgi:hypothetical protein
MNRTCFTCASLVCFALAVFSCSDISNLTTPKSVSVKSSGATYNVPLGSGSIAMSKYLSASKLQENIGSTAEVYDYNNPAVKTDSGEIEQQFLINYPLTSIPLDFSSYLDSMDFSSSLSKDISKDIAIPSFDDVTFQQNITVPDLDDTIANSFQSSTQTLSIPEPGALTTWSTTDLTYFPGGLSITINVSSPVYTSIAYRSGYINITVAPPSTTPYSDFVFMATAKLEEDGTVLSSSGTIPQDLTSGGTLSIPLAGVTLGQKFTVLFDGSVSGGTLTNYNTYSVSSALSSVKISKVTGVTMSASDLGSSGIVSVNQTVSMSSVSDYLISAVVSSGSIAFKSALPDGWSGVNCDADVGLNGGVTVGTLSDATPVSGDMTQYLVNKYVDLSGKTITPNDIVITGTVTLSLDNATVVFPEDDSDVTVSMTGTCSIGSLGKTTVNIDKLVDTSTLTQSITQDFPDEVVTYIKSITFSEIGINGTVTNTLPANDMTATVTVSSTMFQMNNISDSVALSGTDNTLAIKKEDVTVNPSSTNKTADFIVGVGLSNGGTGTYAANTSYITFDTLSFGATYNFAAAMTCTYDWTSITLNTSSTEQKDTISTGLNMSTLLSDYLKGDTSNLLDNVELSGVKAYVYVKKPVFTANSDVTKNPLDDLSFSGIIKAVSCTLDNDGNVTATTDIIDSSGTNVSNLVVSDENGFEFCDDTVNFASKADSNLLITAGDDLFTPYSADTTGLNDVFNAKPDNLGLYYDITLQNGSSGELTLTKTQVDALKSSTGTTAISISVAIVLPLSVDIVNDGIQIDNVLSLAGNEITEDMLNRDSATDSSDWKTYSDLVESITLTYKAINSTGLDFSAGFADSASGLSKSLTLDGKTHTLSLSRDDIESIFNTYPFEPKISMKIADGTVSIPRDAEFGITAILSATTDGEYVIWGEKSK